MPFPIGKMFGKEGTKKRTVVKVHQVSHLVQYKVGEVFVRQTSCAQGKVEGPS